MEESVKVNVKSEGDGRLVIEGADGKEVTYYLEPIRTMVLEVETLEVVQGGDNYGLSTDEPWQPLKVSLRLQGKAVLEDDSISVIGEPQNRSRSLTIGFKELSGEWLTRLLTLASKNGGDSKFLGVTLGFTRRDWEIGNQDSWWVECGLAPEVMQVLTSAISSKSIRGLRVGLRLFDIYTDDNWAPPSMRVTWFLRPNRRDNTIGLPEMAHGELTSFTLTLDEADLRKHESDKVEEEHELVGDSGMPPMQPPDFEGQAILALAANVERLRGTLKWVGGLVAFFLMVMAFK